MTSRFQMLIDLLEDDTTVYLQHEATSGYVVADPALGMRLGPWLAGSEIERDLVMVWLNHVTEQRGLDTIGSWTDSETKSRHFDVGTVISGLEGALTAARARGEIAIWDIANAREIRVDTDR